MLFCVKHYTQQLEYCIHNNNNNNNTHLTALCLNYPGEAVPKGKTNLDFTEARDSEWQHQLGHMQICTSPQTDNYTSTHHLE